MRQRDLIPFFTMTFLIAWGILGLYIFASETMVRLFGNLTGGHPLFYLAVYAPAISALVLVFLSARFSRHTAPSLPATVMAGIDLLVCHVDTCRASGVLYLGPVQTRRL